MKFHMYEGFGLSYPVVEINGKIYGTVQSVAGELGVTTNAIHLILSRRPDLFNDKNCMSIGQSIEDFKKNRVKLGLKYVREDMRLLGRRAMIRISRLVDSERAWSYQEKLDDLAEQMWSLHSVPQEVFEQEHKLRVKAEEQVADLSSRLLHVEKRLDLIDGARDTAASAAGKALRAQRGIN